MQLIYSMHLIFCGIFLFIKLDLTQVSTYFQVQWDIDATIMIKMTVQSHKDRLQFKPLEMFKESTL